MKKIIIIMLLIALAISGCVNVTNSSNGNKFDNLPFQVKLCKNIDNSVLSDKCIFGNLIKEKKYEFSVQNNCKYISDNNLKSVCQNILNKDSDSCKDLDEEFLNLCYVNLAFQMENASLCKKAVHDEKITNNILNINYVNNCIKLIAKETNNVQTCAELADESGINSKDWCVRNVAEFNSDEKLCNGIKSDWDKSYCIKSVIKAKDIKSGNIETCNSLEGYNKDDCILEIALNNNDVSLCANISTPFNCLKRFIAEGLYEGNCEEEYLGHYSSVCLQSLAIMKKDISICNSIADRKDECVMGVAINYVDANLCNNVSNKDYCIYEIAKITNDLELCEKLEDDNIKSNCKLYIEKGFWAVSDDRCTTKGAISCNKFELKDNKLLITFYNNNPKTINDVSLSLSNMRSSKNNNVERGLSNRCSSKNNNVERGKSITFECDVEESNLGDKFYSKFEVSYLDFEGNQKSSSGSVIATYK